MCYKRCEANDTLDDYAPARRSALQVVEDYEFINEMHGGTLKQIAERMGMRYDALWVILKRNGIKHVNRLA